MNNSMSRTALLFAALTVLGSSSLTSAQTKAPPTRQDNVKESLHGVELIDPYRWLEDQKSPETRAWIDAQNGYTRAVLGKLPGREALKQRLGELLKVDAQGLPAQAGGRYFHMKRQANQDLSILYVRDGIEGKDRVLIDPHPMSTDRTTSINFLDVSEDGKMLAYGIRQGGEDEVVVQLFDVDGKKDLPDRLTKARYFGIGIKPDKSGFYYTKFEKEGPRVKYHAMGTDATTDAEIFGKGYGPDKIIQTALTDDGKYLMITVLHGSAARKTEVYVQDLAKKGPIQPIVNDVDARFRPAIGGDFMYLETNWNAPNGRILRLSLADPARDKWHEVVPTAPTVIEGFYVLGGKLIVMYLQNATSKIKLMDLSGKPMRDLELPGLGAVSGFSGKWENREAFFSFASFNTPPTILRLDLDKGDSTVWARQNVPVASDKIEVKQVWYESKDKTKVPMFLVHAKGLKLDGERPTFLTGYGGFNLSRTPAFSALVTAWVERGGVYALPNLRGGGEFGEDWHRAGMLEKKQNVFDDFIGAAEWLIANGYTKPEKLAIAGGSNGGLLVGAAMTQRPELFQAVVCSVPLLDMVRYHKFLVARFWVPEYGSSEDPKQFEYIRAYSPYHRVVPGTKYPALMMVSGDADTRVDPLHARKMTALLQSATGSDRPVLLHYDTKGGHSAGKPVSKTIEDTADELSFLFWQLQVKD